MSELLSECSPKGKAAKNLLAVLFLFIFIIAISPQNVLAAAEKQEVSADVIRELIMNGEPVDIEDALVTGDLDLSSVNLSVVNDSISITSSIIQGAVNFERVYFDGSVNFDGTRFNDETNFKRSTFSESASFEGIKFAGGVNFNNAQFNDEANFNNAEFYKRAHFDESLFKGQADFRDAEFYTESSFYKTTFKDGTQFAHVHFNEPVSFYDATFSGLTDFEFASFDKTANFSNTDFNDEAHFNNATFSGSVKFDLAKFKDRSFFVKTSFHDEVDFTGAYIQLMALKWDQLEGKLVYDGYFYQSLIQNFERLGLSEDANDAYYTYNVEERRDINIKSPSGLIRRSLEFFFLDLSCGYGVKPLRPIIGAVNIIGLFSFIYWRIEDKEIKKSKSVRSLWYRVMAYVFLSFCVFISLGKWDDWEPAEKHENWLRFFVIMEVFLGWMLMALFLISLTMTWVV